MDTIRLFPKIGALFLPLPSCAPVRIPFRIPTITYSKSTTETPEQGANRGHQR